MEMPFYVSWAACRGNFEKEGVKMQTVRYRSWMCVLLLSVFLLPALFSARSGFAETPLGSIPRSGNESVEIRKYKRSYNRAYLTNLAAIACSGVYRPEDSEEIKYLEAYGWQSMHHTVVEGKQIAHFSVFYNVQSDGTPFYLIAFRGSADKKDVLTDLKTGLVPFEESMATKALSAGVQTIDENDIPKVHKGFNDYTHAAMRSLLAGKGRKKAAGEQEFNLIQILKQEPTAQLLLTGHSLGGAVATLMGQRLLSYGIEPQRVHVVTFGAPAIGNKAFAEKYGDRLDLIRVTNRADPIPLSLQALFGGYKQFGTQVKFRVSLRQSNLTHFMNVYLDASQKEYYKILDRSIKEGVIVSWPDILTSDAAKPKVAVWVKEGKPLPPRSFAPDIRRFMINEYKALLPNYVIMTEGSDPRSILQEQGADYLLILGTEAVTNRRDNSWFLTLGQQLVDKEGHTLLATNTAKRTSPEAGNILAAMEAVRVQREELYKKLPWLILQGETIPEKFKVK